MNRSVLACNVSDQQNLPLFNMHPEHVTNNAYRLKENCACLGQWFLFLNYSHIKRRFHYVYKCINSISHRHLHARLNRIYQYISYIVDVETQVAHGLPYPSFHLYGFMVSNTKCAQSIWTDAWCVDWSDIHMITIDPWNLQWIQQNL